MRVEFWGDKVEEIRSFAVADQRSLERAPQVAVGAAVPRAAADRRGPRAGRASWPPTTPSCARCSTSWPKATPSRAWSRSRRSWSTTWSCSSTCCRRTSMVLVCDPERVRARAHDLVATSQEFLQASWAAAAGGGQAPIDLGRSGLPRPRRRPHPRARHADWPGGASVRSVCDGRPSGGARADAGAHGDRRARPARRRRVRRRRDPSARHPSPSAAYRGDTDRGRRRHREAGSRTADASSWSPRVTAPASAWSRCSPSTTSPRAWSRSSTTTRRPTGVVAGRAGQPRATGFVAEAIEPRRAHRRRPDRVSAPPPRTPQRMPSRRRKQIDPLELRDRRLSSCTSSTASAATSR